MPVTYVIENYISEDTLDSVSSEDDSGFYDMENIYNERPSLPLRFEGVGVAAPADPEWICIDMGTASGATQDVTFAAVFNHNLTSSPERFCLKGCVDGCGSGGCDWENNPAWTEDMIGQIIAGTFCSGKYEKIFPNAYKKIDRTQQFYQFEFIDTANPYGYIEVGEAVLGEWCQFGNNVHLQPGRPDGPQFFMGKQETHYGQDWSNYYSYIERFTLTFKNINDIRNMDELQMFLLRVQRYGGKFIIIPDDDSFFGLDMAAEGYVPLCYYVIIENVANYANRLIHGWDKDLREWTIELKTLTTGLRLL